METTLLKNIPLSADMMTAEQLSSQFLLTTNIDTLNPTIELSAAEDLIQFITESNENVSSSKLIKNILSNMILRLQKLETIQIKNLIELNGVYYTNIVSALNDLVAGTNQMKLLGDCDLCQMVNETGNVLPKINKSLVVDLNGFTLTDTNVYRYQEGSGKTLFDYGQESSYGFRLTFELKNGIVNTNDIRLLSFNSMLGSVNIHDVKGTSIIDDNYYINVFNANTVNVTNCEIDLTSKRELIFVEPLINGDKTVVNIKNNKFNYISKTTETGVYHNTVLAVAELATLNTDNNIITTAGQYLNSVYGLYTSGYTANIGNDVVNCNNNQYNAVIHAGMNGYETYICSAAFTINGVNITNVGNGNTILINKNSGEKIQILNTEIINGTFNNYSVGFINPDDQQPAIVPLTISNFPNLQIKGGKFSKEITTETNLADGYTCQKDGNMWIVR